MQLAPQTSAQGPAGAASPGPGIGPLTAAGQLAGLWALAIAQPLFDLLRAGEELVLFQWQGLDIVVFALGVAFLPPALLVAVELGAGRLRRQWRCTLHLVFVGALAAVLGMYVAKAQAGASDLALVVVGAVVGAAAVLAYRRFDAFRSVLTLLGVAPFVTVALFLAGSPVGRLLVPDPPAAPAGSAAAVPVVLVLFDELPSLSLMRADRRLDAGAYRSFAALAEDATWFRNATSPYDFTRISVPAMLSGRRVGEDEPPSLAAYPRNLFTLLSRSHALHVHEQVTRLCPASACPGHRPPPAPGRLTRPLGALARVSAATFLPEWVVRRLPAAHPLGKRPAVPEPARFTRLARAIAGERRPGLFYIHSFASHGPWYRLPSGQTYPVTGCCPQDVFPGTTGPNLTGLPLLGPDRWTRNRFLVAQSRQRHLAQARFADRLLGRLLTSLRASGRYDSALVIVTADHGIAFRPGDHARRLSPTNLAETLGVPLFVKAPFQRRGGVDDALVRTTDIPPTVTQVLGLGNALGARGSSLLGPRPPAPSSLAAYGVLDRRWRHFSPATFTGQRDRALAAATSFFGPASGFGSLFSFGPHRELIGRRPGNLRVLPAAATTFAIDEPGRLRRVDPRAASLPAHVSGVLGLGADGSGALAVELNGRIAATTRAYRSSAGAVRFSALLPPPAFRPGRNLIRVHQVVIDGRGTVALRPLTTSTG